MDLLKEVKKFAKKQLEEDSYEGVSFEFEGQSIINPWVENTARFDLSTEDAIKFYGTANVMFFIEEAVKSIHPEGISFPDEGILLAEIEGELSDHAQIWMHGIDDYAACYPEGDSSIRGSLEDIACDVDSFLSYQKKHYCINRIKAMNEFVFEEIFSDLKQILG